VTFTFGFALALLWLAFGLLLSCFYLAFGLFVWGVWLKIIVSEG
jgi:hypothetical protein